MSIRGNASSNYRTPAVRRAGPSPRTDRNSDCWYSKKMKIRAIHQQTQHRVSNKSIEERSARSLPISDQRICSLQRCPDPCESEHLSTMPHAPRMPRCQPASPRRFTRGLVPPRLCLFVCVPVFRQRQRALPAILFFRCEFLLPGGHQRHPSSAARSHQPPRLRIPPTRRPPTPSIPSSQITRKQEIGAQGRKKGGP